MSRVTMVLMPCMSLLHTLQTGSSHCAEAPWASTEHGISGRARSADRSQSQALSQPRIEAGHGTSLLVCASSPALWVDAVLCSTALVTETALLRPQPTACTLLTDTDTDTLLLLPVNFRWCRTPAVVPELHLRTCMKLHRLVR
jgi:hypothetical protein